MHERLRQYWISDKNWAAIDTRVTVSQEGDQQTVRELIQQIHEGLSKDRKRRVEEAGRTIDSLLASDPPLVREAWVRMEGWQRYTSNRPQPPARISLDTLTAERVELYTTSR